MAKQSKTRGQSPRSLRARVANIFPDCVCSHYPPGPQGEQSFGALAILRATACSAGRNFFASGLQVYGE